MPAYQAASSLLTLCLLTTAGCSRAYEFAGVVLDGNGVPIAGATFALAPHGTNEPNLTDSDAVSAADGTFTAGWCCIPDVDFFILTTSCDGYVDDVRIVTADESSIRIVLARDLGDNVSLDMRELPAFGTRVLHEEGAIRFIPDDENGG